MIVDNGLGENIEIEDLYDNYEGLSYEEIVSMLIREKYSLDEELAIQRQRDNKVEEFEQYYDYCEECKAKAKEIVAEEGDI